MAGPSSPIWEFWLASSADLSPVAQITQARGRSIELALNKPGGVKFTVPMTYDLFEEVEAIKYAVVAYRNGIARHSGPIWNMSENATENRLNVATVGWYEILNRRILRQDVSYPRVGLDPFKITGGQIVFDDPVGTPGTTGYYPGGLLTIANAQQSTWIVEGANTDTMERAAAYTKGTTIGSIITALSESEAGFDWTIDPESREMNIKNWDDIRDRTSYGVFGHGVAPRNLANLSREFDTSAMVNRLTSMGKYGGGLAEDVAAQQEYQLFEEMAELSEVVDPNVLLGYSGGEVALRAKPRIITSITPFSTTSNGKTPQPFEDYDIGDKVVYSAVKGKRMVIEDQLARVFGLGLSINEEGNEKVTSFQVLNS